MNNDKFDQWNSLKKELNSKTISKYVNERWIYYLHLWLNVWFEQNWKNDQFERPIVVLRKFWKTFLWIPLSTKHKQWKFYFNFSNKWRDNVAILSQIRLFDTKRVDRCIWYM